MKNPRHKLRFGFLLEAYCRGIGPNLKIILKQLDAINTLSAISISFKSSRDNPFQSRVNCYVFLSSIRAFKAELVLLSHPCRAVHSLWFLLNPYS
jgi:hypothetical protein